MTSLADRVEGALAAVLSAEQVLPGTRTEYLRDATGARGIEGRADVIGVLKVEGVDRWPRLTKSP